MDSFRSIHSLSKGYVQWTLEQFLRPAILLVCGMLLFNLPTFFYKTKMLLMTTKYLLLCNDKRWKTPPDPQTFFSDDKPVERKTIYFVRHGESTWNDTFNKGKHRSVLVFVLGFFPGLIKAVLYEYYLLLSGKLDR